MSKIEVSLSQEATTEKPATRAGRLTIRVRSRVRAGSSCAPCKSSCNTCRSTSVCRSHGCMMPKVIPNT